MAFTLVELLIVISIISIILTMAVLSFNNTREDSRNNQRISDIKQIQLALERYYSDNSTYPSELNFGQTFSHATSGKIYMDAVPSNPAPRDDGSCANSEYTYTHSTSTGETYELNFCISRKNGDINAGNATATPQGIN